MQQFIITTPTQLETIISNVLEERIKPIKDRLDATSNGLDKEWLTRKEKAKKENISISMVDKLVRQGRFEKKKIGRKTLIKS